MTFRTYTKKVLASLVLDAKKSSKKRQYLNFHNSFEDGIQRLLNAIGPESYIRPHRHNLDPKIEILIAVRGKLTLVLFDNHGAIECLIPFGKDKQECENFAVEISPHTWHTVVANTSDAVILEVKSGPFLPHLAKEYAPWAPGEDELLASEYFKNLCNQIEISKTKFDNL